MSEFLVNLIFLAVGAGISLGTAFFLNERSHKLEREDKKRERAIAAQEIRLKEGEDKIKEYSIEFFYLVRLVQLIIYPKVTSGVIALHNKMFIEYVNMWEKKDKERAISELSVKSLGDEQLTKAWEKAIDLFISYKVFYGNLHAILDSKGVKFLQNEKDRNLEKEKALNHNFLSSVEEFLKRINELRSQ